MTKNSFFKRINKTCDLAQNKHYEENHDDDDDNLVLDYATPETEQARTAEPRDAVNNGKGLAGVLPP